MDIAFVGHGRVGGALAAGLAAAGHQVTIAAANPASESLAALVAREPRIGSAAPDEAVAAAQVVVLATPFGAVTDVLHRYGDHLAGKVLIDCTNPVGPGLTHGLGNAQSGTEMIQAQIPETHVVKAFSIYGAENFEDSAFPGYDVKPVMLFCGNDASAKRTVAELITDLGWHPCDVGGAEQALHLEHMTLMWVRMVRMNGHSPHFVWAMLERP
jgi:8-hydroxy-5-deazaflavin:NADPH oxidoreductase